MIQRNRRQTNQNNNCDVGDEVRGLEKARGFEGSNDLLGEAIILQCDSNMGCHNRPDRT